MKKNEALFQCQFCHKRYQREAAFINHKCKEMIREENLRTPVGQAAWQYYQDWNRLQRRRVPDDRAFLKSNYYQSFNKFAALVKRLNLPSPKIFIKLMVDQDFTPTMWTMDEVYAVYMEHLDRNISPKEHARITADTLFSIADAADCDVGEVFDVLNASELIELIKQRRLSAWVLLCSQKFQRFYEVTRRNKIEQGIILESIIRPKYWTSQFEKKPEAYKYMKKIVASLDL